ncbi:forkhead box protein B2-like [Scylla paramamosain]|uniref:forkhead box protein B2-like n=1 Tax=Scylla paramamosain TaxID=85552 RepID=UPI003083D949
MVVFASLLLSMVFVSPRVSGAALGLLAEDGGYAPAPYLSSLHPLHHHHHYLHLDHLRSEEHHARQAPPGVRPVLLTRPLARPDPRPPSRPHPYSLLYLHYVPLAHLTARDPEYRSSRREEPQPATSTSLRPALR